MNSKRRIRLFTPALFVLVALLACAAPGRQALAQFDAPQAAAPPPEKLVQVSVAPVELRAGGTGEASILLVIEPGWHINANPPSPDYMIPTAVEVRGGSGLAAGKPVYPAPRTFKVAFDNSTLSVYDGGPEIRLPITAASSVRNGRQVLHAILRFQACNDQVCLAPAEIRFEIPVVVSAGAQAQAADSLPVEAQPENTAQDTTSSSETVITAPPPAGSGAAPNAAFSRWLELLARSQWLYFIGVFLAGLALNLTPCVYPMLGVTVSIFGARRAAPRHQVIGLAVLYVLGMSAMYTSAGLFAAYTGGLFGAMLQNPIVQVSIGLMLLGLSLSMFGLYEVQVPPQLMARLGGNTATSAAGAFLSGLVVGVFAAPCIGPPVLALLTLVGAKADPWFGVSSLFVLSMGLGAPYLVLGIFSNLIQSLPRSGEWMEWVKRVFGVVLAALGLFYASLAFAPSLTAWIPPVALIVGGVYLGFFERSANRRPGFRWMKHIVGGAAAIAGVVMVATAPKESIVFEEFRTEALQAAAAEGRPVMVDFTANWCVPCHELERFTFTDRRVRAAARSFRTLRVDLTKYQSPESERLRKQFRIRSVPTVMFMGADGVEVTNARVEGFLPADGFLERMKLASESGTRAAGS